MHKVIKIHRYTATNFLELLNLGTGTLDNCFDDSGVVSNDNFEFMREGEQYSCKMELFGEFVRRETDSSVLVSILKTNVIIGNTQYLEVVIGSDIYYILMSDADGFEVQKNMYYQFTRKDLIQVDDVIHADCF